MAKSQDAFRTISEVADWLGVQAHVLRFWESKFAQIKPVKRAGGRRYYRPTDMLLLGGIKRLLRDDGLTIKGVQKILREQGVDHVADLSPALDDLTIAVIEESAETTSDAPGTVPEDKTAASFSGPAAETPDMSGTPEEPAPPKPLEEVDFLQPGKMSVASGAEPAAPARTADPTGPDAPASEAPPDGTDTGTGDLFSAAEERAPTEPGEAPATASGAVAGTSEEAAVDDVEAHAPSAQDAAVSAENAPEPTPATAAQPPAAPATPDPVDSPETASDTTQPPPEHPELEAVAADSAPEKDAHHDAPRKTPEDTQPRGTTAAAEIDPPAAPDTNQPVDPTPTPANASGPAPDASADQNAGTENPADAPPENTEPAAGDADPFRVSVPPSEPALAKPRIVEVTLPDEAMAQTHPGALSALVRRPRLGSKAHAELPAVLDRLIAYRDRLAKEIPDRAKD